MLPWRLARILALAFFLSPAFGQAPSGPSDYVLFRFFFEHVESVEAFANHLKAEGKDDTKARAHFKNAAKLTGNEESLVKSHAQNCKADLAADTKNNTPVIKQLQAQYPKGVSLPASVAQQVQAMENSHEKIVTSHMQQLQSQMG